MKHKEEK